MAGSGSATSGGAVLTTQNIAQGGWSDHGPVICTQGNESYNAIDANAAVDQNGTPYLAFCSFWDGIMGIELEADGSRANDKVTRLAWENQIEEITCSGLRPGTATSSRRATRFIPSSTHTGSRMAAQSCVSWSFRSTTKDGPFRAVHRVVALPFAARFSAVLPYATPRARTRCRASESDVNAAHAHRGSVSHKSLRAHSHLRCTAMRW